ncbi:MAG: response regulator [Brevundimonas sp.]|jgi:two-component system chemotaxis response regulator CheY|uniref:response regulator n=1 Tax=Brevundimonas sp. TaxID=1871086 RepID=UPI0022BEC393|nr:response regulator [Brevundimonas sp.]MCZ8087603.1 response regulator [Brevundimonas sp.]MCZ8194284.1 response regulator [Brevundimonas sp.]
MEDEARRRAGWKDRALDVRTCLIVDDSRIIRKVARRIIEDLGFEVDEAGDGAEALAYCAATHPDVILLDWYMPVMDGLTFIRRLRAQWRDKTAKVLFCTIETDPDRIAEALEAGADDYVMKPFDGDILHAKLAEVGAAPSP